MPEPDAPPVHQPEMFLYCQEGSLLNDLMVWREQLARSIARNNLGLRSVQITSAVNRIIFPLLFIAAAEDRRLLPAGTLSRQRDNHDEWNLSTMIGPFADGLYEGIFTDTTLSPVRPDYPVVEDQVILDILTDLASPKRRYDFSRMSAVSLGQVLTPYLSRTVRRSAAHHAGIVDTHDAVLSGGTVVPPLILTLTMTNQALDAVRKNRSKREILPERVLDPACGSGNVLVAAYRNLLGTAEGPDLTFEERCDVLAASIHGVDISPHAVAATRMLLVLELLENQRSCGEYGKLLDLVLPVFHDLRHAILCGNALVGPEIMRDESWNFCPPRERHALNIFSWDDHFNEVRAAGGFDLVLCNPPEGMVEAHEWIQQYFQRRYSVYHQTADRSAYFLEKGLSHLRPGGTLAFIMQSRWLRISAGSSLREFLKKRRIEEIAEYTGTGLCSIRVRAAKPSGPITIVRAGISDTQDGTGRIDLLERFPADLASVDEGGWAFRDTRSDGILAKMQDRGTQVAHFCMGESGSGALGWPDGRLLISRGKRDRLLRMDRHGNDLLRPFIEGKDIGRYHATSSGKFFLFIPPQQSAGPAAGKFSWPQLRKRYPSVARLLKTLARESAIPAEGRTPWYETRCRDAFLARDQPKILFPAQCIVPVFMADDGRSLIGGDTGYLVTENLYLLAVLNSRLARFWFMHRRKPEDRRKSSDTAAAVAGFFIHVPDLDDRWEAEQQTRIEKLTRRILAYHDQLAHGSIETSENFRKKIERTDRQIDTLVYELYGLTPDEIAVVEDAVSP